MVTVDLLVLGAGPAGVGAAYRASAASRSVTVIERSGGVGGASASFEVGGQRVDLGSHRLHPSTDPDILEHIQVVLAGGLQRRPRNGRIRLAGRWIAFPLRISDLLTHLPLGFGARAALDASTRFRRSAQQDTFAELLRAGLGSTMCERFYFPYARKLWGLEPEEISGEQARRRVAASSPGKMLMRLLPGRGSGPAFFYYPREGFGAIAESLARAAMDAGADFRLGVSAKRVELRNDSVAVELDSGEIVEGARLWSTVPVTALARLAIPAAPDEVLEAATSLEFRSMVLVYLVLDVDRYTEFDAHYLPEPYTPVTRISEPKNYRDGDDPPGRTVLCAEVPCSFGDAMWAATDDELARVVVEGLADSGSPPVIPSSVTTKRLRQAYPVYRVGFERSYEIVDRWATEQPRLLTFGRQGLFVHDNSHHAYAMAWAAADALRPNGEFDSGAWRSARERFSRHVVED
ncbi:MAG: NAD(P)-binding protein [Actinobacteria bacterium]|nr:NAD(P)-binding protein [Actinomycetota bacterium]